ncbi:hypothetical protein ACN5PA_11000, partial [Aliarcobacter butzleri]
MTNNALSECDLQIKDSTYYEHINTKEKVSQLLNYYDNYRTKKMINSSVSVDESFIKQNELFYKFIRPIKE